MWMSKGDVRSEMEQISKKITGNHVKDEETLTSFGETFCQLQWIQKKKKYIFISFIDHITSNKFPVM